ncbi:MAG: ATP-binding protein [Bacteroidales bacterium]|nr:ATP-binding protein [Bacteroidales bacterium]
MTKIEWIEIDNFRGISHLRYEPKQVNLLIGRNNSGKTSILDAIYANLVGKYDTFDGLKEFCYYYNVKIGNDKAEITSNLHHNILYAPDAGLPDEITDEIHELYYKSLKEIYDKYNLTPETFNNFYDLMMSHVQIIASKYDDKLVLYTDSDYELRRDAEFEKEYQKLMANIRPMQDEKMGRTFEYRIFSRILIDTFGTSIRSYNWRNYPDNVILIDQNNKISGLYGSDDDKFEERLIELTDIIKKYDIVPDLKQLMPSSVFYSDNDGNTYSIPLEMHGTGFSILLMLLYNLNKAKDGYLLIEEPENHLHPGYIRVFVEQLMKLSKKLNVQVFMTSHSYDLINELSRYPMNKEEEDMIQITNIVHRDGEHELYNHSPSDALNTIDKLMIDLRGT